MISLGNSAKYQTLLTILDKIREEAPREYRSYYPLLTEVEKVNSARAKAFIHLFLKVKFGILNFKEREKYITDGTYDGGIDAYYVDDENRIIYLIQSKFRTNDYNFVNKEIELREILSMDIDRITEGETTDENGNRYNDKIISMTNCFKKIPDIARYKYEIIIIANLTAISPSKLRQLTANFPCQIYNYDKCYEELVLPVICGTYYNHSDLFININLANKEFAHSRISYPVRTTDGDCEITILFVPTIEIAKILYKYKNSILKFNPRSYLDLNNNAVNKEIAKTVQEKSTNEFALFNNGITMLSDETSFNERVGQKDKGQLHIKNPQIINGGQTAYTLSKIYQQNIDNENIEAIFLSKEVMLKIITFTNAQNDQEPSSMLNLVEEISRATNQQTAVTDADRRSNDKIQLQLQEAFFRDFGYFYERKKGEYYDGLSNKYIDRSKIIDRELLLRICFAICGFSSQARSSSARDLYQSELYEQVLNANNYRRMFFAYICYKQLEEIQKGFNRTQSNKFGVINFGNALRYGKMAVILVIHMMLSGTEFEPDDISDMSNKCTNFVLAQWNDYEDYVKKQPHNTAYFISLKDEVTGQETLEVNFNGYYKGTTLNQDLRKFFSNCTLNSISEAAATVQ